MKSKIVIFSNLKGGVGKTTLCALFADYLSENGQPVAVVDADLQQSLFHHRQRDLDQSAEKSIPYQAISLNTDDVDAAHSAMRKLKSVPGYILIDCPGTLNDPVLNPIFMAADTAVVPISYDDDTIDATVAFMKILKKTNPSVKLIFVPNRINDREGTKSEKEQRQRTLEILGKFGFVAPRIKQSVMIKRYSTLETLDLYQKRALSYPFEEILRNI